MKNTIITTSLLIAATAASVSAQETTKQVTIEPFVRADAIYAKAPLDFPTSDFKDDYSFGGGLTVGAKIDIRHEVSLSVAYNKWELDPAIVPGVIKNDFSYTQIPVLLNYRYHLPIDKHWTLFAGPSLGISWEESETQNTDLGAAPASLVGKKSKDYISFTYGFTIGAAVDLGSGWSLAASASISKIAGTPDVDFPGQSIGPEMSREAAPSFGISVGYAW